MNWEKKDIPAELVREIAKKFDCDLLIASILTRRGITAGEDIQYFLEDDLRYLRNPFELPAMEDAVDRILAAQDGGEKVLVFGDRDVDGITSTTLIAGLLMDLGMDVTWRVPTGDEAYGLSIAAVEDFAAAYGSLIITVDCGISNIGEVARAKELGIDVIVVDHHNPPNELPQALAIVNPKLPASTYSFRDLSGCGVTYKLAAALRFAQKGNLYGQPICLLNTRPTNDAYVIEAVKLRNLVVIDRITETVIPGMVSFEQTRLLPFLQGQQILVWDAALQRKTIAKVFGGGIEINTLDMAPEVAKEIPSTAGKSLLKIKELSRIAKYAEKPPGELDVFINLFVSFAQKRESFYSSADAADLQLAALGTVADLMPMKDENRIIVRLGIEGLNKNARPGISDLLFKIGFSGRRIGATEVSWQICPAINATGRMGSPETAVRLFLSKDKNEQNELAGTVLQMNEDRKKLGNDIWTVVEPMAEASLETFAGKLALAYGTEIHRGVSGIMANRLVSRFKTPAVVVSFNNGSSIATASLRSTRGYDLRALLEQCADLFLDWGGHDFAAGFSMERKNWDAFVERLKLVAVGIELDENEDEEKLNIDAELPLNFLTPDIFKVVDRFEPYGEGNDPLIFMTRGAKITDLTLMGKPEIKHVKLSLDTGKFKWPAVYWQAAEKVKREFDLNDSVDLVYRLNRNWFNGNETPQLIVSDIKRMDHG